MLFLLDYAFEADYARNYASIMYQCLRPVECYNNLTWSAHVDTVYSKVARKIGAMKRTSRQLSLKARSSFFLSVIQPDLEYAAGACVPSMPESQRRRQYYPSMRAGPPNPGPRSAATRAGMKSGHARIRGVSIVLPTCKPATLKAAGTDICGKLRPARNRFSFCGPPECNGGPAEGT